MVSDVVSFILFIRRSIGLLFTPYVTMRKISIESTWKESFWVFILIVIYFLITNTIHFWVNGLLGASTLFVMSVLFLSILPASGVFRERLNRMFVTWSYTLLPTLIWFYSTSLFFFVIPPPRTTSLLGKSFSVIYIALSISLLCWKFILVYLSIRFSLRIHLYRVIYYIVLYLTLSVPLWLFLYNSGISRIPFV